MPEEPYHFVDVHSPFFQTNETYAATVWIRRMVRHFIDHDVDPWNINYRETYLLGLQAEAVLTISLSFLDPSHHKSSEISSDLTVIFS